MIAIVTDSTCDIPQPLLDQYGVIVVPQVIIWGGQVYHDRVDLQPLDFYQRLAQDPQRPTTSQATEPDWLAAYERAIEAGASDILALTVSSAMSGTYSIARRAAGHVNVPVSVVDSKGPTMTLGWQVLAAARARDAGYDRNSILDIVATARSRMAQFVAMDTLEYLQRGGRIGTAVKWVGGLLQVKPLVSINHQSGLVEPVTLARTHKALVNGMYTRFFERMNVSQNLRVAVLHGNCEEEACLLAERIQAQYHPAELLVNITGPVLGINTGPGALALCGYWEG